MITNRALCSEEERNSCCAIPNLLPVYEYLRSITIGSQGKSFCPFTHHLEKTNGYYLSVCEQLPSEISLDSVLQLLEDQFQKVQSKHCNRNDGYPYVTIGTAFTHEQALNSQFFDELEQYRQLHRLELMKRGIAIAIAHPLHPLGVNNNGTGRQHMVNQSLFRSQIPCILLRLFHPNDAVFMKEKEEEIPAFREFLSKFFPNKET